MAANILKILLTSSKQSLLEVKAYEHGILRFLSTTTRQNININLTPKEALLDNSPAIQVEGLVKDQKITLWNSYTDDAGLEFSSHAHYVANENGKIDLKRDLSYGGKYKGVFPEGLVTSMHTAPPVYKEKPKLKYARLFKHNVTEPMKYTLKVVDGHVSEEELYSEKQQKIIDTTDFHRILMAPGVRRVEVCDNNIRGVLFLPADDRPSPLILDLYGAESGIKEFRSAMLASYGYTSLALPYYQYKDLPRLKDRINLDYFLEGIDYLTSLPNVNSKGIGVIGSSKGGEIGLALCTLTDKIKACVTINCYNGSIDVSYFLKDKLFLGALLGDEHNVNARMNKRGEFIAFGKSHVYTWDNAMSIPIENTHDDCQILIGAGDDDGGHSHRSAMALKERARRFKKKNVSIAIYPGAGHLLDPPFHSHIHAVWNSTILIRQKDGTRYTALPHFYGGNPYDNCQAAKDLWKRSLALFHRRLVQDAGFPLDTTKLYTPY